MIKTILCTGDSHTWGQGADGVLDNYSPPLLPGDLRLVPFCFGSYVNLLRQMINDYTKSVASEIQAEQLCNKDGIGFENGCGVVGAKPLVLTLNADLIRIEFLGQISVSKVEIWIDGERIKELDLQVENSENAYKICSFFCQGKNAHRLEIKSTGGSVLVYRIETYCGEYAVINCGIGSCPVSRFVTEYWDDYVAVYNPSIVVLEPHTINDWIEGSSPMIYRQRLLKMINDFKSIGARPLMLTVSPIAGSQSEPHNNFDYSEYIKASILAAKESGIPIADANAIMLEKLKGLTQEQQNALLFLDAWHVNKLGHQVYAQIAFDTIIKNNLMEPSQKI